MIQRFKDMNILGKIGVAFALVVLTSLMSGGVILLLQSRLTESDRMRTHTYKVLDHLSKIEAGMINQETGLRGYLISADASFLEPYTAGKASVATHMAEVRRLTADNKAQQERLDQAETLAATWGRDVAEAELSLMKDLSTQDEARLLEASGEGKKSMDALRAKLEEMAQVEIVLLEQRSKEASADRGAVLAAIIVNLVLVLAIVGLAIIALARFLVQPVRALTAAMKDIANGALNVEVPGLDRKDELGEMSRAFEANAQRIARLAQSHAEAQAKLDAERRQATLALADQFERNVGVIVKLVSEASTELQASATQLTASAKSTSQQSDAVSQAAGKAGANVTSVASAAEELGASVSEIGRQVSTSSQISNDAVRQAEQAAVVVGELNHAATSIGGVVEMISSLAGQTNLLALNATIESARAGEAGKGFAVVASEVKALASQTTNATSEISGQITKIQDAIARAARAFETITATIRNVNTANAAISAAVDQQTSATQEIIHAVHMASNGTHEVTTNITLVAEASEQTGEAASLVQQSSGELAQQAERLRMEMDRFLATVRAA